MWRAQSVIGERGGLHSMYSWCAASQLPEEAARLPSCAAMCLVVEHTSAEQQHFPARGALRLCCDAATGHVSATAYCCVQERAWVQCFSKWQDCL